MTAEHSKAVMAGIFFAATAVQAITAAHGLTWESAEVIATAVLGVAAVHQVPNSPPDRNK